MTLVDFGENTIVSNDDSGNIGLLLAQQAVLGTAGNLVTLSFYVLPGTQIGNLRLGCYSDSAGLPGSLLAQTASTAAVSGWNTLSVASTALAAATYWLAYEYDNNGLNFKIDLTSGTYKFRALAYASMIDPFGTPDGGGAFHWSLYGTVDTGQPFTNRGTRISAKTFFGKDSRILGSGLTDRAPLAQVRVHDGTGFALHDRPRRGPADPRLPEELEAARGRGRGAGHGQPRRHVRSPGGLRVGR